MIITSAFNRKGGVGKSLLNQSIAFHIASTEEDKKILLIDLDSQSNLTSRMYSDTHSNSTLGDALVSDNMKLSDLILKGVVSQYPNIDLIPANENLKYLEEIFSNTEENEETIILDWLSKEENLETAKEYDYIIWDLAPTNSIVNRNALLTCSNIIFIDQYGTMESISAIDTFLNEYKLNSEELDMDMCDFVILTNMYRSGRPDKTTLKSLEKLKDYPHLEKYFLDTKISYSSVLRNACTEKISVGDYVSSNLGSKNALKQMNSLIKELKEREIL